MRGLRVSTLTVAFLLPLSPAVLSNPLPDGLRSSGRVDGGSSPDAASGSSSELPESVRPLYEKLEQAIRAERLVDLMSVYHLNYLVESLDGSVMDRGPWRRLWLDRFERREHERVAFALERIIEEAEDELVLRMRRVIVFREDDAPAKLLEEAFFDDKWRKRDGEWQIWYRTELPGVTEGTVVPGGGKPPSPRIADLAGELARGRDGAVVELLKSIDGSAPLVEPVEGAPGDRWVTFVWRGDGRESRVIVEGGLPGDGRCSLDKLRDTDLWYRTERLPSDARFTYRFRVNREVRADFDVGEGKESLVVELTSRDPLNPRALDERSLAVLPDAPEVPAEPVSGRASGRFERNVLESEILDERRFVSVYESPGEAGRAVPVLLLGGGDYEDRQILARVLDNTLFEGRIPRVKVLLVHSQGSRSPRLEVSVAARRFVLEEVLPWARERFSIGEDESWTIAGKGPAGALAAWCAAEDPDTFPRLILQSAWLGSSAGEPEDGSVARVYARSRRKPLRLHVEVGLFERDEVLAANRYLDGALEAKGYSFRYAEFPGNANTRTWHGSVARGLASLLER